MKLKPNRIELDLEHHQDNRYKNLTEMKRIAFERAMEYLHGVYQIDDELKKYLESYELKFNNGCRSRHSAKRKLIKVTIIEGREWLTYKKNTLGAFSSGIRLPRLLHTVTQLVHEYTHAIQHYRWLKNDKQGHRAGELETTANELHYVELVSPLTMARLTKL